MIPSDTDKGKGKKRSYPESPQEAEIAAERTKKSRPGNSSRDLPSTLNIIDKAVKSCGLEGNAAKVPGSRKRWMSVNVEGYVEPYEPVFEALNEWLDIALTKRFAGHASDITTYRWFRELMRFLEEGLIDLKASRSSSLESLKRKVRK